MYAELTVVYEIYLNPLAYFERPIRSAAELATFFGCEISLVKVEVVQILANRCLCM
jgi:hypothetical protein